MLKGFVIVLLISALAAVVVTGVVYGYHPAMFVCGILAALFFTGGMLLCCSMEGQLTQRIAAQRTATPVRTQEAV